MQILPLILEGRLKLIRTVEIMGCRLCWLVCIQRMMKKLSIITLGRMVEPYDVNPGEDLRWQLCWKGSYNELQNLLRDLTSSKVNTDREIFQKCSKWHWLYQSQSDWQTWLKHWHSGSFTSFIFKKPIQQKIEKKKKKSLPKAEDTAQHTNQEKHA